MTDSVPPRPPRQPAASSRTGSDGSASRAASARPAAERRRPAGLQLVKVDPEDQQHHFRSLVETIQADSRNGLPGLGVSAAVHAVILLILALIARQIQTENDAPLAFGWVDSRAKQNDEAESPAAVAANVPVRIQSFKLPGQSAPKPAENKPEPAEVKPAETAGRNVKPADVSQSLKLRTRRGRLGKVDGTGEKDTVQSAIEAGLQWLKRQQQAGGNWQLHQGYPDAGRPSLRTDTGATALALLAFLGDGQTHRSGDHKDVVSNGLSWLKRIQKADGDFHDHDDLGRQTAFYAHAQATIAICEAFALTGDESLRKSAEQAVQFLVRTQQPQQGGWRYTPQTVETMADLSVTGWVLMALHTARMAEIEVPDEAYSLASVFLDAVAVGNGSKYRYLPSDPETKARPGMTAEGLLCRQWLGWERNDIAMRQGVEWLLQPQHQPEWSPGRRNVYDWYYMAQTLHNLGGEPWKKWYGHTQSIILTAQKRRGSRSAPNDVVGSWSPHEPDGHADEHSHLAGRLYLTVMCLLVLETPTRHAPLYPEPEAEAVTAQP